MLTVGERIQVDLGDGHRRYSVMAVGRKWVELLYAPTLSLIKVEADRLERNRSLRHVDSNPRTLKRLITATMKERKELGLRSATKAAKALLLE